MQITSALFWVGTAGRVLFDDKSATLKAKPDLGFAYEDLYYMPKLHLGGYSKDSLYHKLDSSEYSKVSEFCKSYFSDAI